MPKPETSALAAAATAFDAELAVYARLGELFLRTPLATLKQLERANQMLGEIGDCETRLQAAGQQLIGALARARELQEQLSARVVDHAPVLQERNAQLAELMAAMVALAAEVEAINASVAGAAPADTAEVSASVLALSDRAEQLAARARAGGVEELATQAHALHQRLKVIGTKLQKAVGN